MNLICIGLQFGDEGKGKVVDFLSASADVVVRFNGGNNTGCTVVAEGKTFKLHHIPAGIVRGKKCVLCPGMVLNPEVCCQEIEMLESAGINLEGKLFIGDRVHLIFSSHRQADMETEKKRDKPIGTTGRGIGNCYSDKMLRHGIRIVDALEMDHLEEYRSEMKILEKYVCDSFSLLLQASREKKNILFEGAQGTLLDVDFGTYPYVTSSHTISSNACTGTGFSPRKIDQIMGIAKAYTTRVGGGPFPTEVFDNFLVERGKEYGTTTGRKRRCGWLDLFALRYAVDLNGADSLALTKLDVLSGLDTIPVCIGYRHKGKNLSHFPSSMKILQEIEPVYKELPGWKEDLSCKQELPQAARDYIAFMEDTLEIKMSLLSLGPDREETILHQDVWA